MQSVFCQGVVLHTSEKIRFRLIVLLAIAFTSSYGQSKVRFPIWTFNTNNTKVYGIALGYRTNEIIDNVTSNGLRFDLGLGFPVPLVTYIDLAYNDSIHEEYVKRTYTEKVVGMNISPFGHGCYCKVNGVNIYGAGLIVGQVNGLSVSSILSVAELHNGVQGSIFSNIAYELNGLQVALLANSTRGKMTGVQISVLNLTKELKGVQIGLFNLTKKIKGLQIGLWNVNEKRKLPFINF